MNLTIRDAEDAALAGWVDFQTTFAAFLRDWYAPLVQMQEALAAEKVVQTWDAMPPQMHAQLQAADPQAYAEVTRRVNEIKKSGGYYAQEARA